MPSNDSGEQLVELYGPERIARRLQEVADQLNARFANERVVAVCVLKGATIFFADLVRLLHIKDLQLDFIGLSSYGQSMESSGAVTTTRWLSADVTGAWILVVEDIVDTGQSMAKLMAKLADLIDKQDRRQCAVSIDYSCFQLQDGFIVGYGLDYAERYRQLPGIYELLR